MSHEFISSAEERGKAVEAAEQILAEARLTPTQRVVNEADRIVRGISRSLSRVGTDERKDDVLYWSQEDLKEILGRNFLGKNAVLSIEEMFRESNIKLRFPLDNIPDIVRCSKADLDFAVSDGEMLILYVPDMVFDGRPIHISIAELMRLFTYADPTSDLQSFFHKAQNLKTQKDGPWYGKERFFHEERMFAGYGFVKKKSLKGSAEYSWNQQENLLGRYEGIVPKDALAGSVRRRSSLETVWGSMLYQYNRGEQLLTEERDWVSTITSNGYRVQIGMDSLGLTIDRYTPSDFPSKKDIRAGVYPARFLPIA